MRAALRRLWYACFQDHPYSYLGRVLIAACPPAYLRRVDEEFLGDPQRQPLWRKIVKAGLRWRYFTRADTMPARATREQFWSGAAGRAWHRMRSRALEDPVVLRRELEQVRAPIVAQLRAVLAKKQSYTTLCEIGTGNGLFLQYLSQTAGFESFRRFVGLDLNRSQIEENRNRVATERLTFESMDVAEWIAACHPGGTVFLTHDTLHLFTPSELERFLEATKTITPAAVALSEPVDPRLSANVLSKPRAGIGIGFSHNYRAYLERSGYTVLAVDVSGERGRVPVPAWYRIAAWRNG